MVQPGHSSARNSLFWLKGERLASLNPGVSAKKSDRPLLLMSTQRSIEAPPSMTDTVSKYEARAPTFEVTKRKNPLLFIPTKQITEL